MTCMCSHAARHRLDRAEGMAHGWIEVPLSLFPCAIDYGTDVLATRIDLSEETLYLWSMTDGQRFLTDHRDHAYITENASVDVDMVLNLPPLHTEN